MRGEIMKAGTRQRIFWIILTLLVMAVIFYLSSQSGRTSMRLSDSVANALHIEKAGNVKASDRPLLFGLTLRKMAHIFLYFLLGICMTGSMKGLKARVPLSVGACYLYAVLDELHQLYSSRDGRWDDTLIDLIGILLGVALFLAVAALQCYIQGKRAT